MSAAPTLRYSCDLDALPIALREAFVTLEATPSTDAFVRACQAHPHGRVSAAMFRLLRGALTDYDAYGLLGLYPMHLLDRGQWARLLASQDPPPSNPCRLLDVGAGAGTITAELAPLFDEVVTTETSSVMAWRLRRRGFRCHAVDVARVALAEDTPFQVVSLLNVLDRCLYPHTLLSRCRALLAKGGRLVIAVPLPLSPHVHVGASTVDPEEPLPTDAETWEASARALIEQVLEPAGWRVERMARAPYLCRGDRATPVRVLDDIVLICR